jgi:hypothetical protein
MTFIRDPTVPTVTALRQFLTVHPEIEGTKRTALYNNSPPPPPPSNTPGGAPRLRWRLGRRSFCAPFRPPNLNPIDPTRSCRGSEEMGIAFSESIQHLSTCPLAQMRRGGASMAMPNYAHPDDQLLVWNGSTHGGEC